MKKGWRVCIDFDGVINSYSSGYKPGDDTFLPDPPTEGAKEFLEKCLVCFQEVFIVSSRCQTLSGVLAMGNWMKKYDMPDIPITYVKYPAEVYIDDRGWRFEGHFPDPEMFIELGTWVKNNEEEENNKWLKTKQSS
jgi:hypothetical protein